MYILVIIFQVVVGISLETSTIGVRGYFSFKKGCYEQQYKGYEIIPTTWVKK